MARRGVIRQKLLSPVNPVMYETLTGLATRSASSRESLTARASSFRRRTNRFMQQRESWGVPIGYGPARTVARIARRGAVLKSAPGIRAGSGTSRRLGLIALHFAPP